MRSLKLSVACIAALSLAFTMSCGKGAAGKTTPSGAGKSIRSVCVLVPGAVAGSPIYEQLVAGAKKGAEEKGIACTVVEAGFNQSEWPEKISGIMRSGKYDLLVTSNPSMPSLCAEALEDSGDAAKNLRVFVADGYLAGNGRIATLLYNQVEQGYIAGCVAGAVTTSGMKGTDAAALVGVVVAQRYPSLDKAILPGFAKGLDSVAKGAKMEERVIGNWYDSGKASELAGALLALKADVLFPVAGGASQGVISAAKRAGAYVVLLDADLYGLEPGTIAGCVTLAQERASREAVILACEGKLEYGKPRVVGFREGYVGFDLEHPAFVRLLPEEARAKVEKAVMDLKSGALVLESPVM